MYTCTCVQHLQVALLCYRRHLLKQSSGIDVLGDAQWPLIICLGISWFTCFMCLFRGIKSMGKVHLPSCSLQAHICRFGNKYGRVYMYQSTWLHVPHYVFLLPVVTKYYASNVKISCWNTTLAGNIFILKIPCRICIDYFRIHMFDLGMETGSVTPVSCHCVDQQHLLHICRLQHLPVRLRCQLMLA